MGLSGPLTQGNTEIDQLLIGNVLNVSFINIMSIAKVLKKDFSITVGGPKRPKVREFGTSF